MPADLLEQFGGEVLRGAKARAGEHDLARFGLGRGDQRLDVLVGRVRPHHDEQARGRDLPDPVERVDRVVAHLLGHDRGDDLARGLDADRVAVLRRIGDRLVAEQPSGARPVLHDDGLTELLLHALRDDARDDVGAAAGAERDDHLDGLRRVVLRRRRRCNARRQRAGGGHRQHRRFMSFLPAALILPRS